MKRLLTIFIVLCLWMASFPIAMAASESDNSRAAASDDCFDAVISGTQDYDAVAAQLDALNAARAAKGRKALVLDPALTAAAMLRAAECSIYYGHTRPDGTSFYTVGMPDDVAGSENIAFGFATPEEAVEYWMESPVYSENVLSSEVKSVGLGCFERADGKKAWVQLLSGASTESGYTPTGRLTTNVSIRILKKYMRLSITPDSLQLIEGDVAQLAVWLTTPKMKNGPVMLVRGFSVTASNDCVDVDPYGLLLAARHAGTATVTVCLDNGTQTVEAALDVTVEGRTYVPLTYKWADATTLSVSWDNAMAEDRLAITDDSGTVVDQITVGYNTSHAFSGAVCGKTYTATLTDKGGAVLGTVTTAAPNPDHVYDDDSDDTCNACGFQRTLVKFKYTIADGQVTITGLESIVGTELVIPSEIEGYPVTTIGDSAFAYNRKITSVVIPDSVTKIKSDAFRFCNTLQSVDLGNSVTTIGSSVFNSCGLTSLVLPDSLITIGNSAFAGCSKIPSVDIPDSVLSIGENAFSGCSSLTSIAIPNGVVSISAELFKNCTSLTSVTIPDSVTTIGRGAFSYCASLPTVELPEGIMMIPEDTFFYNTGLEYITIPSTVGTIARSAFYGCTNLKTVRLPIAVTTIDTSAFDACTSLSDVYYGGNEANRDNRINFTSANGPLLNATWHYEKAPALGMLYTIENGEVTITGHDDDLPKIVVIPSEIEGYPVTAIGNGAFSGNHVITSVTIPSTVKTIGDHAFYHCYNITELTIPEGVTTIKDSAFTECGALRSIVIPDSVTYLGKHVFQNCTRLATVVIGSGLTTIETGTFRSCSYLISVTLGQNITTIGYDSFYLCVRMTSIVIPAKVTFVGGQAFKTCSDLTDVYYGGSEADRASIEILRNNDELLNATWHYNYTPEPEVVPGDADGNGKVNNRDLGLLQQYINGYDVTVDEAAVDMDGNGKVNNRDLGLLQQLINSATT